QRSIGDGLVRTVARRSVELRGVGTRRGRDDRDAAFDSTRAHARRRAARAARLCAARTNRWLCVHALGGLAVLRALLQLRPRVRRPLLRETLLVSRRDLR